MSRIITTRSPVFWVIVFANVALPVLVLHGTAQIIVTLLIVAFVVTGLVRARCQQRDDDAAAAEQR